MYKIDTYCYPFSYYCHITILLFIMYLYIYFISCSLYLNITNDSTISISNRMLKKRNLNGDSFYCLLKI